MKTAYLLVGLSLAVLVFSFADSAWAQGGGGTGGGTSGGGTGQTGGGTGGTGQTGGTPTNTGGTPTNTNGTGNTGGTQNGQNAEPLDLSQSDLNIAPTDPKFVDLRNQGFVGSTGDKIIEQGFVGASTQLTGGQPAEGASFGGGTNQASGGARGAGGGRTTTGGANNALGLGGLGGRNATGGAATNRTQITRRSIRNRLSNQISVERVQPSVISERFQTRLDRLPATIGGSEGVQIQLSSGTAVVSGIVDSSEISNRIERQLRLEPGVYRIENRLTVRN